MKIFKKYASFGVVIFFLAVVGFFLANDNNFFQKIGDNNIKHVKIGEVLLKVYLATTPKEQEQGLSGRISLATDEGMLFVFPKPSKNYFWMKNMNFPIDIIWFGENQKIIFIKKSALPELFPETYGPEEKSQYVLEVLANFSEKNNLKVGDTVEFLR